MSEATFCVILAAGEGKRMRCPDRQKVCLEVAGVPVILRALRAYEEAGVNQFIIVVGHRAEEVVDAIGERYSNAAFVYQAEPLGTGHATKCGTRLLEQAGFGGEVLVVAGDKILEPHAIQRLMDVFRTEACDLAFLTDGKAGNPTLGRVVCDDAGRPAAIVEVSEIKRSQALAQIEALLTNGAERLPSEALREPFQEAFGDLRKARKAGGRLYAAAEKAESLTAAGVRRLLEPLRASDMFPLGAGDGAAFVRASAVEQLAQEVNLSIYLFRAEALYHSLQALSQDNAQGEEFLTDTVRILAAETDTSGRARRTLATVTLEAPEDVLTFNTPEELAAIDRAMRQREAGQRAQVQVVSAPRALRSVARWRERFAAAATAEALLAELYGPDAALVEAKRRRYLSVLECASQRLGPEASVCIVRSPGRINLLGRHIDHRGGSVNVMAISEEILMVAAPRADDQVHLYNADPGTFSHMSFSIGAETSRLDWGDWLACINSPKTLAIVGNGHWGNYVKAAALRLQHELGRLRLRGADIVTSGTIPIGSGLSSSSAVVVGAAEVLITANGLNVQPSSLVDLCGEGEWFVGTRGGSGDHAAIKLARRGYVAHVGFFPFEIGEFVPFPKDHSVVVCNSGEVAKKSEGARETFNSRVLGYLMAELIFKTEFPDFAPTIHHLRDITPGNLGLSLAELYRMLKHVPLTITEEEFLARYGPFTPEDNARLGGLISAISDRSRTYAPRGLLIYGLAECERSRLAVDLLRRSDADGFGQLWQTSHNGDRVVVHDEVLNPAPYAAPVDDAWLDDLAGRLESEDAALTRGAQLHHWSGVYACSTPTIDRIVDLSLRAPGVKGAQLAGAGLGGCAMVLVETIRVAALIDMLSSHGFAAAEYFPVAGAGVVQS